MANKVQMAVGKNLEVLRSHIAIRSAPFDKHYGRFRILPKSKAAPKNVPVKSYRGCCRAGRS